MNRPSISNIKKALSEAQHVVGSLLDLKVQSEINFLQFELVLVVAMNLRKYESSVKFFNPVKNRFVIKNFLPFPMCPLCK